jgi:hypothetical protein
MSTLERSLTGAWDRSRPGATVAGPRLIAVTTLLAAILLMTTSLTEAAASTRIVTRANAREIVALRPQGGQPQKLVHLHRGAVLGTAVSRHGRVLAFASRTFHEVDREHVWTDRSGFCASAAGRRS